jgi:GNAT superfamily N-acetyltransferase
MTVSEIRKAQDGDAAGIGKTVSLIWPTSTISLERIRNVLNDEAHVTTVSIIDGAVVGFADGFLTTSHEGAKRWELDLLAVQPDFQRRGIASTLIAANTHAGQLRGAEMARGLVAVTNIGSQRSFARCGYVTDEVICELLVASESEQSTGDVKTDQGFDFIRVNTINYSGLWIEGQRTHDQLANAIRQIAYSQYNLVGMVVPIEETRIIQDGFSLGFESVGRYQWWQRPLISG